MKNGQHRQDKHNKPSKHNEQSNHNKQDTLTIYAICTTVMFCLF